MNKRTKRLGIGGVAAGGLMLGAAALVIAAGVAKADVTGTEGDQNVAAFVSELYPDGVYLSAPQGSQVARNVCGEQAMGFTRDQEIAATEQKMSIGYSVDVVFGAEWHFCPQYDAVHVPTPATPPLFSLGPPRSYPNDVGPQSVPGVPSQPEAPQEYQPNNAMTLAGASYVTKRGGGHGGHR